MSVLAQNTHMLYRETYQKDQHQQHLLSSCLSPSKCNGFGFDQRKSADCKKILKRECRAAASSFISDLSRPSFKEMEPIADCDHLDLILAKAKVDSQPIIIDWSQAVILQEQEQV